MKRRSFIVYFTIVLISVYVSPVIAQLNIHNAQLFIQPGATVSVQGDLTSNTAITGGGKLLLNGNGTQQINMNGFSIENLEIDNNNNINLTGNLTINNELTFTNGALTLGNQNLILAGSSMINGNDYNKFIVTNGTGFVRKNLLGTTGFLFPVGFSLTEYNPVSIINNGVADNYVVRSLQNVLVDGIAQATSGFANNAWVIGEENPGGSNLTITGTWNSTDELNGFDRLKSGIARYTTGSDWDLPASGVQAATGTGPFTSTRPGITALGTFAITDVQRVNRASIKIKAFLQGAYSGNGGGIAAGLMRDQLRANNAIPVAQPYGGGKFIQQGVQGGTETVNSVVFNSAAIIDDNIVDWVFVTLLDANSPSTKLQTRSALIQKDGDIVDLDGVSPLSFPIDNDGTYHISVGHRNHLSVRTPNNTPLSLVENGLSAEWDFTTGPDKAYADPLIITNTPMIPVTFSGITKYALRGGNTDGMINTGASGKTVIYSGSGNDKSSILSTALNGNPSSSLSINAANYLTLGRFDLNLNGSVVYSGSGNDPAIILAALSGNTSVTAKEHQ